MLEPAGDLGLEQEAGPAGGVVGPLGLELLQRHLAVQLGVERHGDLAQAPPGVRPEDREPRAGGRRLPGIREGRLPIGLSRGRRRTGRGRAWRRARDRPAASARRGGRRARRWPPGSPPASPPCAARCSSTSCSRRSCRRRDSARCSTRMRPSGRDRSRTQACIAATRASRADEVHLHRQDAEEQVAVGMTHGTLLFGPGCWGAPSGVTPRDGLQDTLTPRAVGWYSAGWRRAVPDERRPALLGRDRALGLTSAGSAHRRDAVGSSGLSVLHRPLPEATPIGPTPTAANHGKRRDALTCNFFRSEE